MPASINQIKNKKSPQPNQAWIWASRRQIRHRRWICCHRPRSLLLLPLPDLTPEEACTRPHVSAPLDPPP
jgi:hypothetical protein